MVGAMPSTITSQIHLIQSPNDSDRQHCEHVKRAEVEKAQYAEEVLRLDSEALAMVTRGKRGLAATAQP